MTLRTKTSLLFAGLVMLAVAATGYLFMRQFEDALSRSILHGADSLSQRAADGVSAFLDDSLRDTAAIADNLPEGALETGDVAALEAYFSRMLAHYPKFENGLWILDAQGRLVVDLPAVPELRGRDYSHRDYFRDTLLAGRGIVGTPYISSRSKKPVLTFTALLRGPEGEVRGLLGASVILTSPKALGRLGEQSFGKTGYLYIMDTSRTMILHPDAKRILKQDVAVGANRLLDEALNGFEGSGETVNSRGVAMLSSFRRVPDTRWILCVQQPAAEVYEPVALIRQRLFLVSVGSALCAALVGALLMLRVTRPLAALRRTARQLALPDTPAQAFAAAGALASCGAEGGEQDEIKSLARTFQTLYQRLGISLEALQSSAADWERTFNAVRDVIFILDTDGRVQRMNRAALDLLKRNPEELVGQSLDALIRGEQPPSSDRPAKKVLDLGASGVRELSLPALEAVFEETTVPLQDEAGAVLGSVHVWRDLAERRQAEEKIRQMAYFDHLTGLPNRALMMLRLEQMIAQAQREDEMVAVFFLDLDRFKNVNDTFGHSAGDQLLKVVAERLSACLRKVDTVARQGGDEFVVLLPGLAEASGAATVAEKILAALAQPIPLAGGEVHTSGSIGIALYANDGRDVETLLKHADSAMYQAKDKGRGTYCFFSPGPSAAAERTS